MNSKRWGTAVWFLTTLLVITGLLATVSPAYAWAKSGEVSCDMVFAKIQNDGTTHNWEGEVTLDGVVVATDSGTVGPNEWAEISWNPVNAEGNVVATVRILDASGDVLDSHTVSDDIDCAPGQSSTCPDTGDGWVKFDGLSGTSYPYTAPAGKLIVEVCYKHSNFKHQFAVSPTPSYTVVADEHNGTTHDISHASFRLIDDPTPPPKGDIVSDYHENECSVDGREWVLDFESETENIGDGSTYMLVIIDGTTYGPYNGDGPHQLVLNLSGGTHDGDIELWYDPPGDGDDALLDAARGTFKVSECPAVYTAELGVVNTCEGVTVSATIYKDGVEHSSSQIDSHTWQYPFIQETFGPEDYDVTLPDDSVVTLHLDEQTEGEDCVTPAPSLNVGSCMANSTGPWNFNGTAHGATAEWRLVRYGSGEVLNLGELSDGESFSTSSPNAGTWIKQYYNGSEWVNQGGTHVTNLDQWPSQACDPVEPGITGEATCDGYVFTVNAPGASNIEFDGPAAASWSDPFQLESVSRTATIYWPDGSTSEVSASVDEPEECKLPHETSVWSNSNCEQYWGGYVLDGQQVETFRGDWQDPYGPESVSMEVFVPIPEGEEGQDYFVVNVVKSRDCIQCKVTRAYPMASYIVNDAPDTYWQGPFGMGPGVCNVIHPEGETPSAERVATICSLCEDQIEGGFVYDVRNGNGRQFYDGWVYKVDCYGSEPYYTYMGYNWDAYERDASFSNTGERQCNRIEGCADWIHDNYEADPE